MNNQHGIHVVARAVIVDQDHILIAHDLRLNICMLPGGHIEKGEKAEDALIRELQEEIGHTFTIEKFLGCLEHDFAPQGFVRYCHTHSYNFIFLVKSPEIIISKVPAQVEEHTILRWVPLKELHTLKIHPQPFAHLISAWLENPVAFHSEIHKT